MSEARVSSSSRPSAGSMALRRIMRDYQDFLREEPNLIGISAAPIADMNMFEWHINIQAPDGPLSEVYIHCVMYFSPSYPSCAPKIQCRTPFGHDNVFRSGNICLSMLTDEGSVYERWSSAYSITTILLQLQSFFFEPGKVNSWQMSSSAEICRRFKCNMCAHTHDQPFPAIKTQASVLRKKKKTKAKRSRRRRRTGPQEIEEKKQQNVVWIDMARDCAAIVFGFLDSVSLYRVNWTCREWNAVCERHNLQARQEMICYHSREDFTECILGFGMSRIVGQRNNEFKLHMDYLSYSAWEDPVALTSVWGEPLVHWIPLMINKDHGERAYSLLLRQLSTVHVHPLTAITRLMNGIVISLAKSVTQLEEMYDYESETMLMSEKALIGYFALHHILLWLVSHDEELYGIAESRAQKFLFDDPDSCSKTQVPDLGEYLVCLSCVDGICWDDISQKMVFEIWKRNVLWYTKKDASLNYPTEDNSQQIFNATSISRTVVQFQVFFISEVTGDSDIATLLSNYNLKLGRPSRQSIRGLGRFCSEIARQQSREWSFEDQYIFYWQSLNIIVPHYAEFVGFLEKTVEASALSRYHKFPQERGGSGGRRYGDARRGNGYRSGRYGDGEDWEERPRRRYGERSRYGNNRDWDEGSRRGYRR